MNEWMREADVRTIYEDEKFTLLYHRGAYTPTTLQNAIGRQRCYAAYEIWTYNPMDKMFLAYKNRGISTYLIDLLAKSGIKVKSTSARVDTGGAHQVKFASDEDYFLFKLKYGL